MPIISLGLKLYEILPFISLLNNVNMCFDILENTVDTIYTGSLTPTHTADDTLIYNIQFDTATGEFIMQFGDTGEDELLTYNDQMEVVNTAAMLILEYKGTKYLFIFLQSVDERDLT